MRSAVLLIDGSNFYHSLKREGRLPFDADEFQNLFEQISETYELHKIYFYDAIKSSRKEPESYSKQQGFHERLKRTNKSLSIRARKLRYLVNVTDSRIEDVAKRMGIKGIHTDKLKLFLQKLGLIQLTKEKGVDVLLVCDAIELARTKNVDTILLLSGDADFVPAIKLIKSHGLKTVNLHAYRGSSKELRDACDEHVLISFDENGQAVLK
jgi:uncharacterized protein (TIGR00288 family)